MSQSRDNALKDALVFYGSYHHNRWNQLIHFFCVPMIVWGLMVLTAYTGTVVAGDMGTELFRETGILPEPLCQAAILNVPFLIALGYSLLYLFLAPVAGLTWALFVGLPLWLTSTALYLQFTDAWKWGLLANLLGWYLQIHPGHMILEKRKPALLDSLLQALSTAPLFVWLELLFALGYRRQLRSEVNKRVQAKVAVWKKQQTSKF